jgi:hypothetical protein
VGHRRRGLGAGVAHLGRCLVPRFGHRMLDDYLGMVAARSRPNAVLATAYD